MEQLQNDIVSAFSRLLDAFISVIPALLILIVSLLIGVVVGALFRALLGLLSRFARRSRKHPEGITHKFLRATGLEDGVERLTGAISFWVGVAVVLAVGVNALEPGTLRDILREIVGFLPRLLAAGLICLVGLGVAGIARRSVLLGAVNAGLPWARPGARGVYFVVLTFFAAMAMDHLGVARSILVAAFSIVAGGLVLALALAFGLGARVAARRYIEKKLRAEADDTGIRHV